MPPPAALTPPEQWAAAWSSHDVDTFLALFTDDVLYEDVAFGAICRGKQELRKLVDSAFSGWTMHFELTAQFVAANWAAAEWVWTGDRAALPGMAATARPYRIRGASVMELRDGRIARCSDYWDQATLMRQVGQLPPVAET